MRAVMSGSRGPRRGTERGAALLMALLVLVLVMTAGFLASLAHALERRSHRDDQRRLRLTALVDSAIAEALASLERNPWAPGVELHPFGGGEIGADIEVVGGRVRVVVVQARFAGAERRVRAVVELRGGRAWIVAWRPEGIGPAP